MDKPRFSLGETHWPSERVCVLLTPSGAVAHSGGQPLFFTNESAALEELRPGYFLAGLDIFRVVVFASMSAKAEGAD